MKITKIQKLHNGQTQAGSLRTSLFKLVGFTGVLFTIYGLYRTTVAALTSANGMFLARLQDNPVPTLNLSAVGVLAMFAGGLMMILSLYLIERYNKVHDI